MLPCELLQVSMDEIVCGNRAPIASNVSFDTMDSQARRIYAYYEKLHTLQAA